MVTIIGIYIYNTKINISTDLLTDAVTQSQSRNFCNSIYVQKIIGLSSFRLVLQEKKALSDIIIQLETVICFMVVQLQPGSKWLINRK